MKNFSVVIIGAGAGTRMRSCLPKVMHSLSGKSLLEWVIDSVTPLNPDNIVIVINHNTKISERCLSRKDIKIVYQEQQLGSAHAVMQAEKILKNYEGNILVLSGDVPLVRTSTLLSLIKNNRAMAASITVLIARVENPYGYGRIVRNNSLLKKIVEESDTTALEKQIKEINSGIYCFDSNLWKALLKIKPNNIKKEYYITDIVSVLKNDNKKISCFLTKDSWEIKGINSKTELLQAEDLLKCKKIKELLDNGVSIIDANNVYVSYDAKIGCDTVLYPGVFIDTNVLIGKNCIIKGTSYIVNSRINNSSVISYSYVEGATIGRKVLIGPFSHIREGSVLKESVKIGNFSEIKKALIKKYSKINHLSYIGDANVGESVTIGAGTITCNYDGKKKHQTLIGARSFVGSNVNFIAPIKIGKNVLVAAGSTITRNVSTGKIVIARAKQEVKNKKE
jgi:bifunctional UDP-N-acetylglucosamine pyrophosphorylase/glucosamine-1-phosphate N-acetyltransferase